MQKGQHLPKDLPHDPYQGPALNLLKSLQHLQTRLYMKLYEDMDNTSEYW